MPTLNSSRPYVEWLTAVDNCHHFLPSQTLIFESYQAENSDVRPGVMDDNF